MTKSSIRVGYHLFQFDRTIIDQEKCCTLVGIDEAGRGPLAGPVVAAAVCLDLSSEVIEGINDSKKLSLVAREKLYSQITEQAHAWAVGMASPKEIDRINILQATFLAMQRALDDMDHPWTLALVDGNQYVPTIPREKQKVIIEGDGQSASIAAASIIAKVTRDRIMQQYHDKYPSYSFHTNKGYGTEYHRNQILEIGLCKIHRRSFCENFILQTRLPL